MGVGLPSPGVPAPLAPGEFQQSAPQNVVTFGLQGIGPPSGLYVQRDDVLDITAVTFLKDQTINIVARLLLAAPPVPGQPAPSATPSASASVYTPSSNPIVVIEQTVDLSQDAYVTSRIALAEGYLLSIGVFSVDEATSGQTFVRGFLQRAPGAANEPEHALPLFADFVGQYRMAGWPWGRIVGPADGPGFLTTVHQANPAAGTDWILTGGVLGRWRCYSVSALLTTSAHVAFRTVTATIQDAAGSILYESDGVATQAGGLAYRYSLTPGVAMASLTSVDQVLPLPHDLVLPFDSTIRVHTLNIDAADQWTLIYAGVEQFFE